jgi:hypothetical protein
MQSRLEADKPQTVAALELASRLVVRISGGFGSSKIGATDEWDVL